MGGSGKVGRKISHYQLQSLLGSGGMGEVYLARDRSLGRLAAVKLVPPGVSGSIRGRLLREAQSAVRLQHPAIATLYESGEVDGEAFIAMEYVRGETLRSRLGGVALPASEALSIAASLLEALGHAHAAGILHRDIKPENVMVLEGGGAKLLDFGLAKPLQIGSASEPAAPAPAPAFTSIGGERTVPSTASPTVDLSEALRTAVSAPTTDLTLDTSPVALTATSGSSVGAITEAGHVVGTPGYMSPEQIRGEPLEPSSDLFSMGALLYEALSGQRPFPGRTAADRLRAVFQPGPPRLEEQGISRELDSILERALARDPRARYQTASEFLLALRRVKEWAGHTGLPNTIAALPFTNAAGAGADEHDWIGAALATGLVERLGRDREVQVIPPAKVAGTSAALRASEEEPTPMAIGLRLSCRWLIAGTYQKTPSSLRVSAHLTEVPVAAVALTRHFEGGPDAILDAQDDLHRAVQARLRGREESREASFIGTRSSEAYERYARGRQMTMRLDKRGLEDSIALLEEAVRLDPHFASAHAALGRARGLRSAFVPGVADFQAAVEAARRALSLDPNSADGHYTLGYVAFRQERLEEGLRHMRRAMELAPLDPVPPYMLGGTEGRLGRREMAIQLLQTAVKMNPSFGMAWISLGWLHLEVGNEEEAVWCLREAVATEGVGAASAAGCAGYLGDCLRRLGRLDQAREACLSGLAASERTDHIYRDTFRCVCLCSLGRVALDQGDAEAAKAAFTQAITHLRGRPAAGGGGFLMAQAEGGLARAERSVARFRTALEAFERREELRFTWVWGGCSDDLTLLELALAARDLGLSDEFEELIRRAREAHVAEALLERLGIRPLPGGGAR